MRTNQSGHHAGMHAEIIEERGQDLETGEEIRGGRDRVIGDVQGQGIEITDDRETTKMLDFARLQIFSPPFRLQLKSQYWLMP